MTNRVKTPRTAGLIVLGCLLASCGAPSTRAAGPGQRLAVQQGQAVDAPAKAAEDQDPMESRIASLNLDAGQVQKLHTLIQKLQPPSVEQMQQRVEKIKAILSAKDIAVPELIAHINESREHIRNRRQAIIAAVVGVHDILTPEQRTKFAQMEPPEDDEAAPEIAQELQLNDEQMKALAPLRPAVADKLIRTAIRHYMQTGDQVALDKEINESVDKLPSPETVANAMASLSLAQRQKLIEMAEGRIEEAKEKVKEAKGKIEEAKDKGEEDKGASALPPAEQESDSD